MSLETLPLQAGLETSSPVTRPEDAYAATMERAVSWYRDFIPLAEEAIERLSEVRDTNSPLYTMTTDEFRKHLRHIGLQGNLSVCYGIAAIRALDQLAITGLAIRTSVQVDDESITVSTPWFSEPTDTATIPHRDLAPLRASRTERNGRPRANTTSRLSFSSPIYNALLLSHIMKTHDIAPDPDGKRHILRDIPESGGYAGEMLKSLFGDGIEIISIQHEGDISPDNPIGKEHPLSAVEGEEAAYLDFFLGVFESRIMTMTASTPRYSAPVEIIDPAGVRRRWLPGRHEYAVVGTDPDDGIVYLHDGHHIEPFGMRITDFKRHFIEMTVGIPNYETVLETMDRVIAAAQWAEWLGQSAMHYWPTTAS